MDKKILDIFYNQIIKEATTARIDCYFVMNIVFNTSINNEIITNSTNLPYDGIIILR